MTHEQIGRSVMQKERKSRYDMKLIWFRKLLKNYFEFRIALLEKRMVNLGRFIGYKEDLFHAAVYEKQAYLYRIEALYSKQELRDYEKRRDKASKVKS